MDDRGDREPDIGRPRAPTPERGEEEEEIRERGRMERERGDTR